MRLHIFSAGTTSLKLLCKGLTPLFIIADIYWSSTRYLRNKTILIAKRDREKNSSNLIPTNKKMATAAEPTQGLTKPIFKNGCYVNPWETFRDHSAKDVISMMTAKDSSKIPSKKELDEILPILRPDFREFETSPKSGVRCVWLGHASVLVQFDGLTILTDPIFSQRCSPVPKIGPKRYRDPPCTIDDLPKIDAVIISHNHYDHLDHYSVKTLNKKYGDELKWFVPMGLASWMKDCGCKHVVELSWWDHASIPEREDIKFVSTPSQHFCNRGLLDRNKVLWASWCVIGPQHRFFFGGDTGYCPGFSEIGREYGPFDFSAIPIGAYFPRSMMECIHVNPEEALQIHKDVKSNASLAIHWGTFKLTSEYYLEPKEKLEELVQAENMSPSSFFTLKHGEIQVVGKDSYNEMD